MAKNEQILLFTAQIFYLSLPLYLPYILYFICAQLVFVRFQYLYKQVYNDLLPSKFTFMRALLVLNKIFLTAYDALL